MIRVSVLYPQGADAKFDMDYFLKNHLNMVKEKLGDSCKKITVETGLSGPAPGTEAAYAVMCHMQFNSVEEFQTAFTPHAETLMGDMPNYSNVQPVIQISEVKLD